MFVTIQCADKKRKPVRIPVETVAEYREFVPDGSPRDKGEEIKTVIIFKKAENKKDLYSSNTIEDLDRMFNPTKP